MGSLLVQLNKQLQANRMSQTIQLLHTNSQGERQKRLILYCLSKEVMGAAISIDYSNKMTQIFVLNPMIAYLLDTQEDLVQLGRAQLSTQALIPMAWIRKSLNQVIGYNNSIMMR
eukprot:1960718-Ditylum_brightwellii.AAC.1